jgi:hypothetical protein
MPVATENACFGSRSGPGCGNFGQCAFLHRIFAFLAGFSPVSFDRMCSIVSIMARIASGRVRDASCHVRKVPRPDPKGFSWSRICFDRNYRRGILR